VSVFHPVPKLGDFFNLNLLWECAGPVYSGTLGRTSERPSRWRFVCYLANAHAFGHVTSGFQNHLYGCPVPGQATSGSAGIKLLTGAAALSCKELFILSVVGGALGGSLLLSRPCTVFAILVPWLVLVATLVFAWGHALLGPSGCPRSIWQGWFRCSATLYRDVCRLLVSGMPMVKGTGESGVSTGDSLAGPASEEFAANLRVRLKAQGLVEHRCTQNGGCVRAFMQISPIWVIPLAGLSA
jgi:hypothetical protein